MNDNESFPPGGLADLQDIGHCAAASLASDLAILGINTSQYDVAGPQSGTIEWEGMNENDIRRAARRYHVKSSFIAEFTQNRGGKFAKRLRAHLQRGLPAVLLIWDFGHWVAVVGHTDDGILVMDPNDNAHAFEPWSVKRLIREGWNDNDKADDEDEGEEEEEKEPSQYFAILLERSDGKPTVWRMTKSLVRLCEIGSEDTAEQMASDLKEMVKRAGGAKSGVQLEAVLERHVEAVVGSVDHWTGQPKIVDFRKQLLLSRVVRSQSRTGTDSGAGLSALRSWASWIAGLVAGGEPRRLSLSRGAFVLLSDFARKLDRAPAGQMGLAQWGPILAAKISLLLHVFSADPGNEITEATMRTAIALTECLLGESASTARSCVTEQEGIDLEDQLDRMEEKINKLEPVRWRKLRRTYPDKDPAPLLAIFEELVRRGRARRRERGLIETVPKANEV